MQGDLTFDLSADIKDLQTYISYLQLVNNGVSSPTIAQITDVYKSFVDAGIFDPTLQLQAPDIVTDDYDQSGTLDQRDLSIYISYLQAINSGINTIQSVYDTYVETGHFRPAEIVLVPGEGLQRLDEI